MTKTNFYFGKLEFPQSGISDFGDGSPDDEVELRRNNLFEYVSQADIVFIEPQEDGEEAAWRFGKCEIENGYILGKFGKEFTEEQTQWDDEKEDYVKEREKIEVADVSHFVIFPEIPGIAFNRKLRIGPNQFRDAFVRGYNNNFHSGGKINMNLLRTGGDKEFQEIISKAERITEIEFELEPTNPYPEDDMQILDEHIREMNADEFKINAQVEDDSRESDDEEEESLNPNEDFIRSGAALSEGGYGEYILNFISESGEDQEYNSRGERAKKDIPEPETVGGLIPYLQPLLNRLEELTSDIDSSQKEGESDTDD